MADVLPVTGTLDSTTDSAPTDLPARAGQNWQRNRTALAQVDPELARQLDAIDPQHSAWVPAITRDGTCSFRQTLPDGRINWLGRSSIPRIRAEAVLRQFDAGWSNVMLPSLEAGEEAALLLERFGPQRAIFVWESSLEAIRLTLGARDFAQALLDERLVLLTSTESQLQEDLLDWLRRHEGHLCPERLLVWPWQQASALAALRNSLEGVFAQIQRERDEAIQHLIAQPSPPTGAPLAIVGLQAREETWQTGEQLARAAREPGTDCILSLVLKPGDVHPLPRVRQLRQGLAEDAAVILLDHSREAAATWLPRRARVLAWLSAGTNLPDNVLQQFDKTDHLAVTTQKLARRAIDAGHPPERVHVIPPFATVEKDEPNDSNARPIPVLLLADVPPANARHYGVRLATHEKLWDAALDHLRMHVDALTEPAVDRALLRSEEQHGATIEDPDTRRRFVATLTQAAINVLCHEVVKSLQKSGIAVPVAGAGWSPEVIEPLSAAPLTPSLRLQFALRARTVIHLDLQGQSAADALAAAAAGAVLIARSHAEEEAPGGLSTLLKPGAEFLRFSTLQELTRHLTGLAADPKLAGRITAAARTRIITEHTALTRFQQLRATLNS